MQPFGGLKLAFSPLFMASLSHINADLNRLVVALTPVKPSSARRNNKAGNDSNGPVTDRQSAVSVAANRTQAVDHKGANGRPANSRLAEKSSPLSAPVEHPGNNAPQVGTDASARSKSTSSVRLSDLARPFAHLKLSPEWLRRVVQAATSIWAGFFFLFGTNVLPYYPEGWRILLAMAVACLWMVKPRLGTVLALVGFVLPLAYNLPAVCVPACAACLALAVALPADSFLVFSLLLVSLLRAEWLLPIVPLAAGFLRVNRGIVTAGLACLFAELFLLLNGHGQISGPVGSLLIQFQTSPVASLTDWSWLQMHDWRWFQQQELLVPDAWMKLGRIFADRPEFVGQIFAWALTSLVVTILLRKRSNRFAPKHIVAVGSGAAALVLGNYVLWSFVAPSELARITSVGNILIAAGVVMLLAPAWTTVVSTANAKNEPAKNPSPTSKKTPTDRWSDLAGVDDIQVEIQEAVRSHFNASERESLRRLSLQPTKGMLFFGPPGTGKTKLARLIAGEANATFYAVSGTEFVSKWHGESEANLREIFETAREHRPAVLFFDELEAFLPRRADLSRSDAPEKGVLATFLAYTDGIANLDGVFLVAATNHPELIDPAALRPGRFDKVVYVSPPDAVARRSIFERYLKDQPLAEDVNLDKLAALTERYTGADIQAVCKEAVLESLVRARRRVISMTELVNAIGGTKASVTLEMLRTYEKVADQFGRRSRKAANTEVVARTEVGWNDVVGLDQAKNALREAVEMPLTHGDILRQYGVKPSKGVLLYGPPGCGKTLLAKVVARQAKAHFLHIRGPELLRQQVGQSEAKLRELFDRARENAPCVLFFDEMDALAGDRGNGDSSTKILTQFLTEMDGFEELKGVVVVGATNRPDSLDPALLRPGRFDQLVYVPPPDQRARAALFSHELRGKPVAVGCDFEQLASRTSGYSSADIANLCNSAAVECVKEAIQTGAQQQISMQRLQKVINRTPPSIQPEEMARYEAFRGR
jgi:transitional endoplasmic reticulum ATPase